MPLTGLLLHQHHLQNIFLEDCPQEKVNDLRFLDGQGEEVDLLQGLGLHVLDQVVQLGDGDPLLGLGLASESSMASPDPGLNLSPESHCQILHKSLASHSSALPQHCVTHHLVFPQGTHISKYIS